MMMIDEDLEPVWFMDNACVACLMVECICFSEPTPEAVIELEPEEDEELGEVDFDEETAPEKRITQKKLASGKTMKWVTKGQLTTVKTTADWTFTYEHFNDTDKFMYEVKRWAKAKPEDTDEVFSEAMVKYAELLVSHPEASNAYYMTAIKNNQTDRGRKRKVEEVTMEELPEQTCELGQTNTEWFNSLTENHKTIAREVVTEVFKNPDKPLSLELKRKLKRIPLS